MLLSNKYELVEIARYYYKIYLIFFEHILIFITTDKMITDINFCSKLYKLELSFFYILKAMMFASQYFPLVTGKLII